MPKRRAVLLSVAILVALVLRPDLGRTEADVNLKGSVEILPAGPGGTLVLPLPPGAAPVTIQVLLGSPALQLAIVVTANTFAEPSPLTLVDGDSVKIAGRLAGGAIVATEIEREDFPEIRLRGIAQGLPGSGALPLPPGVVVDFVIALGVPGGDIPVRLTSAARLEHGPFVLANGSPIEIEGRLQEGRVRITEIGPAVAPGGTGGEDDGGGAGDGTGIGGTVRVRCRIPDGRVRIQVDGLGLTPGTYTATATNTTSAASVVSKPQTATATVFDLDFDFDSTAGPADLDTFVPASFVAVGQTVSVTINPGALGPGAAVCTAN
jgi:hypothetical protein